MELSKPEILVLEQIANANKTVKSIATALGVSDKQIYVTAHKLRSKGFIELSRGFLQPKRTTFVSLLLQILSRTPNLAEALAYSGIPILTALLKPATIQEIKEETGFQRTIIYDKLKQAKRRNMVKKRGSTYELNDRLWSKLRDFFHELMLFESATDDRVPAGSIIYHKSAKTIVFSSKENLDAAKTAFSAYEKFGIEILTVANYYFLPKRKLTIADILQHSLYVVQKEKSARHLIFIALFYAKFRSKLKIMHPIVENLKLILSGKEIKGYPRYQEIKDRADIYKIKV